MTRAAFQRINGCELRHVGGREWIAIEGNTIRAKCQARNEKIAAFLLSEEVLRQNRHRAMARDNWQCVRCGSSRNLHAHHKIHRGMGAARRDDRVENLETLDQICHDKEHGVHRAVA